MLLEKKIVFGHKKICTLVSWLFSPTFGVQIRENGLLLISQFTNDMKLKTAVFNAPKRNVDSNGYNCVSSFEKIDKLYSSL